jgi:RHS repeat-associated protein
LREITFNNGNITKHFYDDQAQKYKTTYYNSSTSSTKYNWFLFGAIYEYISSVASFNLKEIGISGQGRAGVYKQDAAGLAIATGHAEYQLTDHLGNVRVTFKKGTGTKLDILSKTDYYAFGGQLPGRIWQQSGGDYRYGYQGQQKSQDDVNWDNFELRNFNHDLGRWSAPDPYGQFHSPYIAMANDPVSAIDPDGGYQTWSGYRAALPYWAHTNSYNLNSAWFGVDGPESGGGSGGGPNMGGGIFGGDIFSGGIGFDQLDGMDGNADGMINGTETIAQYNESISPGYSSLNEITSQHYDAFVNSFGTYIDPSNSYNKKTGTYGKWSDGYYVDPNTKLVINSAGGYDVEGNSFIFSKWNSVGGAKAAQANGGGGFNTDMVDKIAGGIGVNMDVKEVIIEFAKKSGDIGKSGEKYLSFTKAAGKMMGVTGAVTSWMDYNKNPSTGALVKAFANTGLVFLRVNPFVGFGLGIFDLTGGSDWFYNQVGNGIDNMGEPR